MLRVVEGVPVYAGESSDAACDLWFIPAFGESHLCFREAWSQPVGRAARVIVFDPPGFGAAPARREGLTLDALANLLPRLVAAVSGERSVAWVAHSMASIAAARAASQLGRQLRLLISVEGNLTPADAFLTGQAAAYASADEFYTRLCDHVLEQASRGNLPLRYFASLQFADPATLWKLGRSVVACTHPGKELAGVRQPTVYYFDPASLSEASTAFLAAGALRQRRFDGCGHWPMLACPDRFYGGLLEDLVTCCGGTGRPPRTARG